MSLLGISYRIAVWAVFVAFVVTSTASAVIATVVLAITFCIDS